MPSEELDNPILAALGRPLDVFRSALAATHEQVIGILDGLRAGQNGRDDDRSAQLGSFSAGRIDIDRFTDLILAKESAAQDDAAVLERARGALAELIARKDDLYVVDVEPGGCLRNAVGKTLEEIGRAFGAARVVHLAQTGRYVEEEHAGLLAGFPFARWSRAERELAPALVVHVDGQDLAAERIASFLDGSVKLVLVARGRCAPARLVRLITPRTFVGQAADGTVAERLAAWDGPGVVAILGEGAAHFVHDPAQGKALPARLVIESVPEAALREPLGGFSSAQMNEELAQLSALADAPAITAGDTAAASDSGASDPADKLAAWLLKQADLGT